MLASLAAVQFFAGEPAAGNSIQRRPRLEGAANLCLRRRDWRASKGRARSILSRGTSDRSAYRDALSFAAFCIEATPPLRKDLRSPAELQLCTRVVGGSISHHPPPTEIYWPGNQRLRLVASNHLRLLSQPFSPNEVSALFTTDRFFIYAAALQTALEQRQPIGVSALTSRGSARKPASPPDLSASSRGNKQPWCLVGFSSRSNHDLRHPGKGFSKNACLQVELS